MKDPTRLLDDEHTSEEVATLLCSLSAPEAPSPAKQAELARKLGAMTGPTAVATGATALWVKAALVLGMLGLAGAWAAIELRKPEPSPARQIAPALPTPSAVPKVDESPVPAPGGGTAPTVAVVSPDAPKDRPLGSSRPKVAVRDSLADEEALLEQARRVASSSPSQALGLLEQHQRRFPNGQLTAERLFLSVDVLTRLGQTAAGRKQAERLIRAFPASVYAAQVKSQQSPQ